MRKTAAAVLVLLFLALAALASWAADTAVPAAPPSQSQVADDAKVDVIHGKINTDDPVTLDPGHGEVVFSYDYSAANRQWDDNWNLSGRGDLHASAAGLAITLGIAPNIDASLGLAYLWLYDEVPDVRGKGIDWTARGAGLSDTGVGFRWRFFRDENSAFQAAYLAGFTIPTGSRSCGDRIGTSQGFWSCNEAVVATKDWGRFTTNAEIGYSLPFGDRCDGARGTLISNLACGYQVRQWLQPELELNYNESFAHGGCGANLLAATAGLIFPFSEHFMLKVGIEQGLTGRNACDSTTGIVTMKLCF